MKLHLEEPELELKLSETKFLAINKNKTLRLHAI